MADSTSFSTIAPFAPAQREDVTLLLAGVAGGRDLWQRYPDRMSAALLRSHALLSQAVESFGGTMVRGAGDPFCAAFVAQKAGAREALGAALEAQRALQAEDWHGIETLRLRMALSTGDCLEHEGRLLGSAFRRGTALLAAAHGGQILVSEASAAFLRESLAHKAPAVLRDLGALRLRDLAPPAPVCEVVPPAPGARFPPPRTLDTYPTNLPTQGRSFVGREREMAALRTLLARADVRLVTLCGARGTGKTRLALQAAAQMLDEFEHGVYLVELAGFPQPGWVAAKIARALGRPQAAAQDAGETLKSYLRDRQLLLVLDQFEKVLPAAPLLGELLDAAPHLTLLVTSRAALGVPAEHLVEVEPLGSPSAGMLGTGTLAGAGTGLATDTPLLQPGPALSHYDSVDLFIQRALVARPALTIGAQDIPAIAEICLRLQGLPLAIELVAAHSAENSPSQMLAQISAYLARPGVLSGEQGHLRAAIAWSYDALADEEQTLLRRLAIFTGGCTAEAAAAVCSPAGCAPDPGLERLLQRSLIYEQGGPSGQARFMLLDPVESFALDRLLGSGDGDALRRRHAGYYLALARRAALKGAEQIRWLSLLEEEHDNLRQALEWALAGAPGSAEQQVALQLVNALAWFWALRGHWYEGRQWIERARAAGRAAGADAELAQAACSAGQIAWLQGEFSAARALFAESLALWERQAGAGAEDQDPAHAPGAALALAGLGHAALGGLDVAAARQAAQASALAFARRNDPWGTALATACVGAIALSEQDLGTARRELGRCVAQFRTLGDAWGLAHSLMLLGETLHAAGDMAGAGALFGEQFALAQALGYMLGVAQATHCQGMLSLSESRWQAAAEQLKRGLELYHQIGYRPGVWASVLGLACLLSHTGQPQQAARLFGAAEALEKSGKAPQWPAGLALYTRSVAVLQRRLDAIALAAEWTAGRTMVQGELDEFLRYVAELPASGALPAHAVTPAEARVVIIEDNRENLMTLVALLQQAGVQRPEWRTTGGQVLSYIRGQIPGQRLPDLILVDLNLPGENGYAVLAALRAETRLAAARIVAVTAHSTEEELLRARQAGFDGFVGKPVNPDRFPEQIRAILAGERVWDISAGAPGH